MEFLKLLLLTSLITTTFAKCNIDNVAPIIYNVIITPHVHNLFFGTSNITLEINSITSNINLKILGIELQESATSLISTNGKIYTPSKHIYEHEEHVVNLTFHNPLSRGLYILYVKFESTELRKSQNILPHYFYKDEYGHVWISHQPFPTIMVRCPSHVSYTKYQELPAKFHICVEHIFEYFAVSNMEIQQKRRKDKGMALTYFKETPMMPASSIMVLVLNFKPMSNINFPVNMWSRSHVTSKMQYAHYAAKQITQYIGQYITSPNQISKKDLIAIPNLPTRYTANEGIILYNEGNISYDNSLSIFHKLHVTSIIAEGLLDEMLADLVRSDSWLSTGIKIFYRTLVINKIFPVLQLEDLFITEHLDRCFKANDIAVIENLDTEIYNDANRYNANDKESIDADKAFIIVRMLQHIISPDIFRNGMETYIRRVHFQQPRSITPGDLWTTVETAIQSTNVSYHNLNIREVMNPWIEQRFYPLVTVSRNYESGETIITQQDADRLEDQEGYQDNEAIWYIPLSYTTQKELDFKNTLPKYFLTLPRQNLTLNVSQSDWLMVNVQRTGYYRVNYDEENWVKIAKYLDSWDYEKIHVLNRAQLIDDAFYFTFHKVLNVHIFFKIIYYLRRETNYVAWYPMFQLLSKLEKYFEFPESRLLKFQISLSFFELMWAPEIDSLSKEDYMANPIHRNASYWACTLSYDKCLSMAYSDLENHIADPERPALSPHLYKWTYCFGLKSATKYTWDRVWQLYRIKHDSRLLEFLACCEDPYVISHYLEILNKTKMPNSEKIFAFRNIIKKHARTNHVLGRLLDDFQNLVPKSIGACNALKMIISNVYSKMHLKKIKYYMTFIVNDDCAIKLKSVIKKRMVYIECTVDDLFARFMTTDQVRDTQNEMNSPRNRWNEWKKPNL